MKLTFNKQSDFIVLRFNNDMLAMELEDLFSHVVMGAASINVEPSDSENLSFTCEFDEGERKFFNIFCKRIKQNPQFENKFTLSRDMVINAIHGFVCDKHSKGGYFSSVADNTNACFITLCYSQSVYSKIYDLSSLELLKLLAPSVHKVVQSIASLGGELERSDEHWSMTKKLKNRNRVETCSTDFFMSTIKDYIYDFYDVPDQIELKLEDNSLICDFLESDEPSNQLSFLNDDFGSLVRNAFHDPSAFLEEFAFDSDKELWIINYVCHC
jgi:hypothetical protein